MSDTIKAIPEALRAAADILIAIPSGVWGAIIILCGQALAAFAIYAVLAVIKGKQ